MASRDPAAAMQRAVFAALTASADVIAAFGGAPRIYDSGSVPADSNGGVVAAFPYLTIGEDQIIGAANQNTDLSEVFAKIEVWSRANTWIEAKTIAGAIRSALDVDLAIVGHGMVTHNFVGAIPRMEPDGLTRRIIVTLKYDTGPAFITPYL